MLSRLVPDFLRRIVTDRALAAVIMIVASCAIWSANIRGRRWAALRVVYSRLQITLDIRRVCPDRRYRCLDSILTFVGRADPTHVGCCKAWYLYIDSRVEHCFNSVEMNVSFLAIPAWTCSTQTREETG